MNRCYVLGAGFSKPFGFPLSCDLTRLAWEQAYGCVQPNKVGDFARRTYESFLHAEFSGCDFDSTWPDFEELLTTLDEYKRYYPTVTGLREPDRVGSFTHLYKTMRNAAVDHLYQCAETERLSDHDTTIVRDFVKHVQLDQDAIVSFNWDTLVEISCHSMNMKVSYSSEADDRLKMLRPHGSLNVAQLTREKHDNHPPLQSERWEVIWETEKYVAVKATDPADAKEAICDPLLDHKTSVVDPSSRKDYGSAWIREQWRMAHDVMARADEVLVLGFSLPPRDVWPRAMFRFSGANCEKRRRLVLVAPDATRIAHRYKELGCFDVEEVNSDWRGWFQRTPLHSDQSGQEAG